MFQSKHNFQVLSCLSCVSCELWSSLSSEAGGGGSGLCSLTGRAELSSPSQAAENPARPSLRSLPLLPGPATRTHTAPSRQILSSDGLLAQHGSLFRLTLITLWPKSLMTPVNDCLLSPGLSGQAGRGPGHAGDPGRLSSVSPGSCLPPGTGQHCGPARLWWRLAVEEWGRLQLELTSSPPHGSL